MRWRAEDWVTDSKRFLRNDPTGTTGRKLPTLSLTPPALPLAAMGYERRATDAYVEQLASLCRSVCAERQALHTHVARLERAAADRDALKQEVEQLRRTRDDHAKRQHDLTYELYAAERFAAAIIDQARRDAELTLKNARVAADDAVADARRDRTRRHAEAQALLEQLANQMRERLALTDLTLPH